MAAFVLRAGLVTVMMFAWASAARAQSSPAVQDLQAWVLLLGQIPVGDQWLIHAEVQPRFNDDISQADQLLLRGGIGRRFGRRVTAWAGYGYGQKWNGAPVTHEQRTWEQVNATLPKLGKWAPSMRFRQEQRFLEQSGDWSHRFRALGRVVHPIGASPWSFAAWDEWFVTLDDTANGPRQGFDQNRVYLTALRKISSAVTLECGYMWQHSAATTKAPERNGHTLFTSFTYAPPVR
ncbi:hypothetical protein LuPra_03335 [Luteitalea pratensis]|uniref:DUF2490 domain-containing protein n=1 Tax=Luteitalea pratensis TaxID=1855912 RepID=A0A143PN88_LUTPR|nr:DUF2490 domain-containing protein [Luteitalea pratensis]AMY10107.1 hypothetical protein LuPra_03335 [Luteitalea pratensis]